MKFLVFHELKSKVEEYSLPGLEMIYSHQEGFVPFSLHSEEIRGDKVKKTIHT